MKLKRIFVNNSTCEGIHSVCLKGSYSEYEKLYEDWNDITFIRRFCINNLHYLQSGFYGDISLEQAINEIIDEVGKIFERLLNASNYEALFLRLNNNETSIKEHSLSKMKISKKSKLRIYAIRLTHNTFIITGGAIKVVEKMEDHNDTKTEYAKLNKVRDWLRESGIHIEDDLIFYYEQ